jgi:hypothetical protein
MRSVLVGFAMLSALAVPVFADTPSGVEIYAAMGIETADVLSGTVLSAKVVPGERKQAIGLITYLTGKKDEADAINVRLAVFDIAGARLVPVYSRDLGAAHGGFVSDGDLLLLDIDADRVTEIIVSFDSHVEPLIEQRKAEVILYDGQTFTVGWTGPVEYDATRAARDVPEERRDRYVREFDFPNTMRTRGVTLFMNKKVIAVAGARLPEPKVVQETFELRPEPSHW